MLPRPPASSPESNPWMLNLAGRMPPLIWHDVFGFTPQTVEIEIGSGKGRFLRKRAEELPEVGFLGVERAGKFLHLSASRIARDGRKNIRMLRADAFDLLARWVPCGSVSRIHVYFPDPWPKKRHAKRRLLGRALFDLAARALAEGGRLAIATDVIPYFEEARGILGSHPAFEQEAVGESDHAAICTNYAIKYAKTGRAFRLAYFRRNRALPPEIPPVPTRRSLRDDSARSPESDART